MAKPYETVIVVDAMIPDESIASEFDAIGKLIETQGKMVKLDRWGKRKLAYPIRKRTHGEYAVFYYESESGGLSAELDKRLRINENVLRWLTVADNPVGVPADKLPEAEGGPAPEANERPERGGRDRDDREDRGDRGDRRPRRGDD
ncbi:MAG TPA: 30S ribosomal protein S6 [Fibrobacteria bacterium]|nr:30S ribosomal protein S6 [Fibrobacteria bacterium]